jgi:hypothetical protein
MPDENPTHDLRDWDALERDVVYLLTDPDRSPTICSVADIGLALDTQDPMVLIRPLCGVGLLHRTADDFVFATPAAYRMVGLVGRVA